MSYQVLARKWRPRDFSELVGQEHVERALVNALDNDRLHHAFLFTGTRGVGKTTIARILAKSLNCEVNGVSSNPCGECAACVEIDEGRFVDLIEVDAASRTKVDETRELLDNVQYAPVRGRFKVYLIDEVHMLSKHSFNALLKTLEEPPPHIKFLLATTDPQKLPITVLSRCLQFSLKRLPESLIEQRIAQILAAENVEFDEDALSLLAVAADGSLRDALSLVDQAIPFGNGAVRVNEVRDMLGTIDREHVYDLLECLISQDAQALLAKIAEMDALAPDYAQVLDSMNDILQRMAIAKEIPQAVLSRTDGKRIITLSEKLPKESIQLFYQIALHGRRDLYLSPTARGGFEMTLLRLLAFEPARVDVSSSEKKTLKFTDKATPSPSSLKTSPRSAASTSTLEARAPTDININQVLTTSAQAAYSTERLAMSESKVQEPKTKPQFEPVLKLVEDVPLNDLQSESGTGKPSKQQKEIAATGSLQIADWVKYYQTLPLKGAIKQLAKHCVVVEQRESKLGLLLDEDVAPMLSESLRRDLESAISQSQGFQVKLNITVGAVDLMTPAQREQAELVQKQQAAVAAIENDPFVLELQKVFDATVDKTSIKPLN